MFAHINIDFNWKDEVLCYLNPSESFKSGKPVSSVNFHLWLHFSLKFDVLLKKIKVLICSVKETILKIVLSNDYIIVYEDTELSWLFKISMTILSSNCKAMSLITRTSSLAKTFKNNCCKAGPQSQRLRIEMFEYKFSHKYLEKCTDWKTKLGENFMRLEKMIFE